MIVVKVYKHNFDKFKFLVTLFTPPIIGKPVSH